MPYRIFCAFVLAVSIAFIGTAIGYEFLHLPNSTLLTKLGIMSLLMGLYMYFDAKDITLRSDQLVLNTYVRQISIILGSFMFVAAIKELLDGKSVQLANFGTMEMKRKSAREVVHPSTKQRTLVPEKMQLTFKPSTATKEQLKNA